MSGWYKMNPVDWNGGTDELTLEQEAAYLRICNAIYIAGGAVSNNAFVMAGLFRCNDRRAKRLLSELSDAGKITIEGGLIFNRRAMDELSARDRLSAERESAGRRGGVKSGNTRRNSLKDKETGEAIASSKTNQNREDKSRVEDTPSNDGVARDGAPPPDPDPPADDPPKQAGRVRGAARKTRIPHNWAPSPANYAFASQSGLSREEINHEADQFRNSAIASGRLYTDWNAAFRTWLGNTVKWRAERAARTSAAAKPGGQSRGGGLVAAGLRHIGEARGYGQPVPEGRGMGAGDEPDRDVLRLTGS